MATVKVKLLIVGGGPTLDYADAAAFFAEFEPLIDRVRQRRIN